MIYRQVQTNLFLLMPNNSGTTFLEQVLNRCENVAHLPAEGQFIPGFVGPTPIRDNVVSLWTEKLDLFTDPAHFDWPKTKRAWQERLRTNNTDPRVFVEKSPPNLLRANMLIENFPRVKFLVMVRNPYAVAEGICRQNPQADLTRAATHLMTCFKWQDMNLKRYADRSLFFTYERMCAQPNAVAKQISNLIPDLHDVNFQQKIKIKGRYHEQIRNMNAQQIERLSPEDIQTLNRVFHSHEVLLRRFGYSIL
ncbi:MAG: sulfotransferase [Magnetococcales bacterium]|nr:sulfotransferase [Magnetococcales bacterium]